MGMTLGQKIRTIRQQLSLSQQQLAGAELTRAFISLVEQDKCQPSTQSLQILARRLDKPIEYFLEKQDNDEVEAIDLLLLASDRALEAGDVSAAIRSASSAVRLSERIENRHLQLRALRALASIYASADNHERALEAWEEILDIYKQTGERRGMAEAYFQLGVCAHVLEEYGTARRHYLRSIRLAEGKKSLRDLCMRAAENLTACLLRLGDHEGALKSGQLSLETARQLGEQLFMGRAHTNLSLALRKVQRYEEATQEARTALSIIEQLDALSAAVYRHNLAVCMLDLGQYSEAVPLLESCLENFRARGEVRYQAHTLEELARFWLATNRPNQAEECCQEALRQLDIRDDGVLRGRLYRMLGKVYRSRGQHRRAEELLRISLEILRRLKSVDELMSTMAELSTTSVTTADNDPARPGELAKAY